MPKLTKSEKGHIRYRGLVIESTPIPAQKHSILPQQSKLHKLNNQPEPRGRKSRPTMLSSTDDFPELCQFHKILHLKNENQ